MLYPDHPGRTDQNPGVVKRAGDLRMPLGDPDHHVDTVASGDSPKRLSCRPRDRCCASGSDVMPNAGMVVRRRPEETGTGYNGSKTVT